jgi:hypothetical protein
MDNINVTKIRLKFMISTLKMLLPRLLNVYNVRAENCALDRARPARSNELDNNGHEDEVKTSFLVKLSPTI